MQAQLEKGASTNAMLRTTTALTVVNAGNKDNVIPGEAQATVNFRLLPGDTTQSVMQHVRGKAGERFELIALPGASEPSPVSPTQSASYQMINRTVRSLFPGTLVAPADDRRHRLAPLRAGVGPHLPFSRCAPSRKTWRASMAPMNASPRPTSVSSSASTTSCCAT